MTTVHVDKLSSTSDPMLEARVKRLEQQVADLVEAISSGYGVLFNRRWAPVAYSLFSRASTEEQEKILAVLSSQDIRVVFPEHVRHLVTSEKGVTPNA